MPSKLEDAEGSIELNADFDVGRLEGVEIVALVNAWLQGGIGGRVLHHNLAKGEVLPADIAEDFEKFTEDLEERGPSAAFGRPDQDDRER